MGTQRRLREEQALLDHLHPFATLAGLAVCVAPPAHVREHSGKSYLAQHPTRRCAAVRRGALCEARAGRNAPLGQNSSAPHAQPRVPGRPGLATGLTAGSSTHRVHAHSTFAMACCCPPWSRLTRHCCCSVAHGYTHKQVVHVLASPGASTLPVSKWRAMARARAANLAFAHEAARGLPPFAAFVGVRSGRRVRAASDSAPGRAISMRGVSMKRVHARVGVMPVPTPSPRSASRTACSANTSARCTHARRKGGTSCSVGTGRRSSACTSMWSRSCQACLRSPWGLGCSGSVDGRHDTAYKRLAERLSASRLGAVK